MDMKRILALIVLFNVVFFTGYGQNKSDKFVVVLDAGHGGKDPGTNGNGFVEKDVALGFTLKAGEILEKHEDIKVIYTRKTDVFITLDGRTEIANEAYANLFVSIHCNAAASSAAYGTETFVLGLHRNKDNLKVAMRENSVIFLEDNYEITYNGFDPNKAESYIGMMLMQAEYLDQSILLASFIQNNFTQELDRRNRGVKQAGFLVLRKTYMPSVLIETGFLSNDEEGHFLSSRKGQNAIAEAIANAVLEYKKNIDLMIVEANKTIPTTPKSDLYEGITFKVQIAASSNKLKTKAYNFRGLNEITRKKIGELYKYYYGATSDYTEIKNKHQEAKTHGFSTSYIVAFKNGAQISVSEALQTKTN